MVKISFIYSSNSKQVFSKLNFKWLTTTFMEFDVKLFKIDVKW